MAIFKDKMITQMKIRGFSPRTQTVYTDCMKRFVKYFRQSPDQLTLIHINIYQEYLVNVKKVSWSFFNQTVCALRFFYNNVLDKNWSVKHIPFQKKDLIFLQY